MKFDFFQNKQKIHDHLFIYILSLLDPKFRVPASLVNKKWYELMQLTKRYMDLLPTLRSIPMFSQVTLDVLRLKLMTGGMTNATCRVKVGPDYGKFLSKIPGIDSKIIEQNKRETWAVRFPGDVSLFSVNRKEEKYNALQASELGLNVPIAYFNEESGVQVTEFIKGVQPIDKDKLKRHDILSKLAAKAKILHSSERFKNDMAVFERNTGLLNALIKKDYVFPEDANLIIKKMNHLEQVFASYQIKMVPCHNDSTPLNYMLVHRGINKEEIIFQIDWEYSSNNDFLWDLAYFAIEAKLSKEQELVYLTAYFGSGNVTKSIYAWYAAYKPIVEWWITLWSWTQLAFGASSVDKTEYEHLGKERYERTMFHLGSKTFNEALSLIESERSERDSLTPRAF